MKRVSTLELKSGMVTAEDVYNYADQLIFPKGFTLNNKAIAKLQFYAIAFIRVVDDGPEETSPADFEIEVEAPTEADAHREPSHREKVEASEEFKAFQKAFTEGVQNYKERINDVIQKNAPLDVDALLSDALNIMSVAKGSFTIFDMLSAMEKSDDITYTHCLNVGLFCNVFCGWLHLSEQEKNIATLAGLLCDIGKLKIPSDIMNKSAYLSPEEYKIAQTHALEGYNLLKNLDINPHIKNAALMHHERCDGTGYPFGLNAERIDPYAKIVAIADVYDAMTSKRTFRNAMSPFQAVTIIQEEGLQKYDAKFVLTFLENVMNTFIGYRVKLSTGQVGEIVFIPKDAITRPTVKCGNTFIKLAENKSIKILDML